MSGLRRADKEVDIPGIARALRLMGKKTFSFDRLQRDVMAQGSIPPPARIRALFLSSHDDE